MNFLKSLFAKKTAISPVEVAPAQTPAVVPGGIAKPVLVDGFISIDELAKAKIVIGTILSAKRIEGSDKLLAFSVDMGPSATAEGGREIRSIVSGVAKSYELDQMIGRQVPVVANLPPRKLRGVESNGMILYAIDETVDASGVAGHRPIMLCPERVVPNGSLVQ